MAETSVADRLKAFIERRGLTSSQFADTCGIPRPSLSQLLTGRNKKISDVMIGQIHNMFPELSITWLLFGEGPMETAVSRSDSGAAEPLDYADGLFSFETEDNQDSKKIIFSGNDKIKPENSASESLKKGSKSMQEADGKIEALQNKIKELQLQIEKLQKNPRKVEKIMLYYDDSTFEEFFPR